LRAFLHNKVIATLLGDIDGVLRTQSQWQE
jgi:hypothetical protein